MGLARPQVTREQLLEGKETLKDGHELFQSLPALISDAKRASTADPNDPSSDYFQQKAFDPQGYSRNLELAEKIRAVFEEFKKTDEHGPHFILAWRMYPNKEHPRWHERDGQHACGCGFGDVVP
jgi:hypothetical protein